MKLYNTLTRQNNKIEPLNPPQVSVYTCGPTVYDYAHIGHWFNYVRMDTLIRTLIIHGYKPKWVMNITDVGHLVSDADDGEDKLEKGARREGKTAWEVAEYYTSDFLTSMNDLNIIKPDYITKATDHIADQIELIKKLEEKGYTYVIDDGIYYDTSLFEGYASFARLDLDDQQEGARVAINVQKRNASDFALWKFSPKNKKRDMEWDSPWGRGFPGWHIECSAMAMRYLGETLDIHTGGIDHIPVHHTNEIAQSEAVTGKRFAQVWMHSNHVLIKGEKISKSLGNGIHLNDLKNSNISPLAVRLHILESHYRSQSTFSLVSLEAANNRLLTYKNMAALRYQTTSEAPGFDFDTAANKFKSILGEDLATPSALAFLSEVESKLSTNLIRSSDESAFCDFIELIDQAFGLKLFDVADITKTQKELIIARETAKANKSWAEADKLRDQLNTEGIGIRDTQNGPIWYRTV
jgi:cysteinyl-tRNA synthetase